MKTVRTYAEEPTEFHKEEVEVSATGLRENDRFKHRSHGWVTVVSSIPKVKKVAIKYRVDGSDAVKTTHSDIEIPPVTVVRQEETREHELWRLETSLEVDLANAVVEAQDDDKKERKNIADRIVKHGVGRGYHEFSSAFRSAVTLSFLTRVRKTIENGPHRRQDEGRFVPHDPATSLLYVVAEWRDDIVNDRGRSMGSLWQHAADAEQREAEVYVVGRTYSPVGRLVETAERVCELRGELGVGPGS